jgi:hypothetical protein
MERLFSVADREAVKVILFEDFVADPKRVYEEVLAFLRVPSDGRSDFPVLNENRRVRWPLLQRGLTCSANYFRLIRSVSGWKLAWGLGFLPGLLFLNSKSVPRSLIPPGLQAELADFYREDTCKLSRLLGRDLSHWVSNVRSDDCRPAR